MMAELGRLKDAIHPDEILLVANGMTGQDAVRIATGFDQALSVTGVILTKIDGNAQGGAALSIYGVLKKPIKYIGVGEKVDALEDFHPDRVASRSSEWETCSRWSRRRKRRSMRTRPKKLEKKVRKEGLDLGDFLTAMGKWKSLDRSRGSECCPAWNAKLLKQANLDPKSMKHLEAIVLSMTAAERKNPGLLNGSRRSRVAKGSGRPISEVDRLLDQFRDMQRMIKKAGASGDGRHRLPPGNMGMR